MSRVAGSAMTQGIRPTTEVMSHTENPIGTLFSLWHASRHDRYIPPCDAQAIYDGKIPYNDERSQYIMACYPEHGTPVSIIRNIAKMNLQANVPSAESLSINFVIHNCSVALREQIVRSKLSSYWTQTSRTADLRVMDVNRSESIEAYGGSKAAEIYNNTVGTIRSAYRQLNAMGVPMEEIRLAPEARVHRIMWMTNVRTLTLVLNKRMDWMAQTTLWSPVIEDMMRALRDIDPMLGEFFGQPPGVTIRDGKVIAHAYDNENEDRYYGRDPQPVDPLWLAYKDLDTLPEHTNFQLYHQMKDYYSKLWSDEILNILGWERDA